MATRVSDFTIVTGESEVDVPITSGASEFPIASDLKFPGRIAVTLCYLLFTVRNMTGDATVFINDTAIGHMKPTSGATESAQVIVFFTGILKDANNKIVLKNVTDAFKISNMILCWPKEI